MFKNDAEMEINDMMLDVYSISHLRTIIEMMESLIPIAKKDADLMSYLTWLKLNYKDSFDEVPTGDDLKEFERLFTPLLIGIDVVDDLTYIATTWKQIRNKIPPK